MSGCFDHAGDAFPAYPLRMHYTSKDNLATTKNKPTHMKTTAAPKSESHTTIPRSALIEDGLPTEETDQTVNLTSLRWLFVAPPGFGKTEFFSLFPNSLMLACEEGHKFVKGHKVIIDDWGKPKVDGNYGLDSDNNMHMSFLKAKELILDSSRFDFVSIDTLDALLKKCSDHHLAAANMQHLSELGDYGKGYDLGQNNPIRRALEDLFSTGRGLGLITHQHAETKSFTKGPKTKKETTLPNGIAKIVIPQVDVVIHGEFGAIREGFKQRDRIIRSEGGEDILAKNRGGVLPPAWISPQDKEERKAQMLSFFTGTETQRKVAIEKAYSHYLKFYEA